MDYFPFTYVSYHLLQNRRLPYLTTWATQQIFNAVSNWCWLPFASTWVHTRSFHSVRVADLRRVLFVLCFCFVCLRYVPNVASFSGFFIHTWFSRTFTYLSSNNQTNIICYDGESKLTNMLHSFFKYCESYDCFVSQIIK